MPHDHHPAQQEVEALSRGFISAEVVLTPVSGFVIVGLDICM